MEADSDKILALRKSMKMKIKKLSNKTKTTAPVPAVKRRPHSPTHPGKRVCEVGSGDSFNPPTHFEPVKEKGYPFSQISKEKMLESRSNKILTREGYPFLQTLKESALQVSGLKLKISNKIKVIHQFYSKLYNLSNSLWGKKISVQNKGLKPRPAGAFPERKSSTGVFSHTESQNFITPHSLAVIPALSVRPEKAGIVSTHRSTLGDSRFHGRGNDGLKKQELLNQTGIFIKRALVTVLFHVTVIAEPSAEAGTACDQIEISVNARLDYRQCLINSGLTNNDPHTQGMLQDFDDKVSAKAEAQATQKDCNEGSTKATSACTTGEKVGAVATAASPVAGAIGAMNGDTSSALDLQGDATLGVAALNAAFGANCLRKVSSCIRACEEMIEGKCETPGLEDPKTCKEKAEGHQATCEKLKGTAIASLAQAGIMGVVGSLLKKAGSDLKDDDNDEEGDPTPPPLPPALDGGAGMNVGVGSLSQQPGGEDQFAVTKTNSGAPATGAPPPEGDIVEKGEVPKPKLAENQSGSGSSSSSSPGGAGLPPAGSPSAEEEERGNSPGGQFARMGGEGFLSGGSTRGYGRRGSSSSNRRGYGRRGVGKSGKSTPSVKKPRAKRTLSSGGSRHQNIFEIASRRIQVFCRTGNQICK